LRVPPYHWWRTVFFLIPAISVYTIVLGAISIASSLVDRRGYTAHRCARAWSWLILKTTGVVVAVEGLDRVTPGLTYVFVSNHQSIYDIPVIFSSLPYQLRIIAKESLSRFPVLGWHLRRGGHLFVDRRRPDHAGILRRWRRLVSDGLSRPGIQGRQLSPGARSRIADRAARRDQYTAGHAEGATAHRARPRAPHCPRSDRVGGRGAPDAARRQSARRSRPRRGCDYRDGKPGDS
jgi:1-acyl-sn-glycerol-3-phosphate acyltransferase